MAKILTTPCIAVIRYLYFQETFSMSIQVTLLITCVGVALASVSDLTWSWVGMIYAIGGVGATSINQIVFFYKFLDN